ncbi:MAG TPA: ABC transporter permease [Candidatus Polarisedimenticolia bacterium]|nr:ABC transporter permease [Candidatus Polarisedimenticolia bacterium]
MRRIWAVAVKDLRQAARDPFSLLMLLGIPTFMLLLYGYALNFDVRHVRLAVQDLSHSAASRDLVASFLNSTHFDLAAALPAGADLETLTERRQAKAILVIPESFSGDLEAGRRAVVQLILDGTDAGTASTVLGYASALADRFNASLAPGLAGTEPREPLVDYRPRVWFNPELESTQFIVPGLIGFILMLTAVLSTALSVVREKERGTMEQLLVTSLRPGELIAGKMLPYLAISLAATAVILAAARLLFDVVVKGPYLHLFLVVLVYLIGALGLGLLVSSVSHSQSMAFQVGALISMLPAIFLSGFIFPIRSMPAALQAVTYLVPARYFLVIVRGIILKGAGIAPYWPDMLFLVANAALMMGLAWARLTRREA